MKIITKKQEKKNALLGLMIIAGTVAATMFATKKMADKKPVLKAVPTESK